MRSGSYELVLFLHRSLQGLGTPTVSLNRGYGLNRVAEAIEKQYIRAQGAAPGASGAVGRKASIR